MADSHMRSCVKESSADYVSESESDSAFSKRRGSTIEDAFLPCELSDKLEQLRRHPLFGDLQLTLALECLQSTIPFSLLADTCSFLPAQKSSATYVTVSDSVMQQHLALQDTLSDMKTLFPSLISIYQQITEKVESQRYRALTYNCYSDSCKQLINWFYDRERELLIHRMLETIGPFSSSLPLPIIVDGACKTEQHASHKDLPTKVVKDKDKESPLDLSSKSVSKTTTAITTTTPTAASSLYNEKRLPFAMCQAATESKKSRFLSKEAISILQNWYTKHRHHPYATDEQVQQLAVSGSITPNQVKKWMANTRARSCNTLTHNGGKYLLTAKRAVRRRLSNKSKEVSVAESVNCPVDVMNTALSTPLNTPLSTQQHDPLSRPPNKFVAAQSTHQNMTQQEGDEERTKASDKLTSIGENESTEIDRDHCPAKIIHELSSNQYNSVERCAKDSSPFSSTFNKRPVKSSIESLKEVVSNVSSAHANDGFSDLMHALGGSGHHEIGSKRLSVKQGKPSNRYLTIQTRSILNTWFRKHLYRPYPTHTEKRELASVCGISAAKVDTWFANKRNRTHITKMLLQKRLNKFSKTS